VKYPGGKGGQDDKDKSKEQPPKKPVGESPQPL